MRYEYKYFVPNFKLAELRNMLQPFAQLDRQANHFVEGHYTVRSIYFDTPSFEMYHTKRDHLANRQKVRLRGYNNGDREAKVFCEIKRKYEGPILKNRAKLSYDAIQRIFEGEQVDHFLPQTVKADNIRRFFYQIYARRLAPVINVIYEREPYEPKVMDIDNNCRITIDKNLRSVPFPKVSELFTDRDLRYPLEGQFILEVKFNNYCPAWMKPILATMDLLKTPASKYVLSIDSQPFIKPNLKYGALMMTQRQP